MALPPFTKLSRLQIADPDYDPNDNSLSHLPAFILPRLTTSQAAVMVAELTAANQLLGFMYYNTTSSQIIMYTENDGKEIKGTTIKFGKIGELAEEALKNRLRLAVSADTPDPVGIFNLSYLQFINDVGIILVDDLMPVEFITNDYGTGHQTCSLFTGGLPSSSTTPSALVELQSTTGALLVSRMTQTQVSALKKPANGMMVYNTDMNLFNLYQNGAWQVLVTQNNLPLPPLVNGIVRLPTPVSSYKWTIPDGITCCRVTIVGGGGAGGSAIVSEISTPKIYPPAYYAAPGGGAGSTLIKLLTNLTPGDYLEITVGRGGYSGSPNTGQGVGSGVTYKGITYTAPGGSGGRSSDDQNNIFLPGSGGVCSGGDFNQNGQGGQGGSQFNASGVNGTSGMGGSSSQSGGVCGIISNDKKSGQNGINGALGSGGSGAYAGLATNGFGNSAIGGYGGDGLVIIEY